MLLETAMRLFVEHHQLLEHSPRTIEFYSMHLQNLDRFLMLKDLALITVGDLRAWLLSLQHQQLAPNTRRGAAMTTKVFFKWCTGEGLIEANPAERLELPKKEKRIPNALTTGDVLTLINDIHQNSRNSIRDTALIVFMTETGVRRNELLNLTVADLHVDQLYATVLGKGNKARWVFFGEVTQKLLAEWVVARPASLTTVFGLTESGLREVLRRIAARTGVKLHPHLFRRTSATLRAASGASATDLQLQFGWESVEMANTYVERAAAMGRAASQAPLRGFVMPDPTT